MFATMFDLIKKWLQVLLGIIAVLFGNSLLAFKNYNVALTDQIIGEGAFGTVYIGTDPHKTNKYAVKKLFIQTDEQNISITKEIEAFSKFKHINIVVLLDVMESKQNDMKIIYLLFPYVKNGSLRTVLTNIQSGKAPKLSLSATLSSFAKLCAAVDVLHQYSPSYVHQDIKAENVLIDDAGSPLLTDFGSVRLADISVNNRIQALSVIDQSAQFCTASYRAPELYDPPKGCRLDCRTDVWALGCLLFAWWFGYSPFECDFSEAGVARVQDCSQLRVLAAIPRPSKPSCADVIVLDIVEWILKQDIKVRPYCTDIITKLSDAQEYHDFGVDSV